MKGCLSKEASGFGFGEDVSVLAPCDESWVCGDDLALFVAVSAVYSVDEVEAECSAYEFEASGITLWHVSSNHLLM